MGGPVFWNAAGHRTDDLQLVRRRRAARVPLRAAAVWRQPIMRRGGRVPGTSRRIADGIRQRSAPGTGIVWASMPTSQDGIHGLVAGVLRAFNAETLHEIWNSEQNAARDRVGTLMKFVPPVVVNGKRLHAESRTTTPSSVYGTALERAALRRAARDDQHRLRRQRAGGRWRRRDGGRRAGAQLEHRGGASRHVAAAAESTTAARRRAATVTWSARRAAHGCCRSPIEPGNARR